ncbi:WH1 domain family protein [Acanthocheilonema viteae]
MRERMHHYECHRNIGSLLPSDNLNMRIAASFGSSCRVLAASFIELLEDDFEMIKWRKIGDGIVCYIYDFHQNLTFLTLIEPISPQSECVFHKWTITVKSSMIFEKNSTNFITLHAGDNKIYGMNFCLRTEAERFYQMLRLHSSSGSEWKGERRDEMFDEQSFSTDSFSTERIHIEHSPRGISSLITEILKKLKHIFVRNHSSAQKLNSGDGGGRAKSIEISGPLNFEHKIHIGLDSVHGYEDNDFLKKILRETQLLFGSRETLIANERYLTRKDESQPLIRQCSLKNAVDSMRLHIRKQSRTTLSCVKHFDQVKRNNRKSTNFGDKLLEITQSSNMQQTVTISGEGYSDPPNNLNGSNRMNLQTTEEMDHPETPRKCYDRKQKLTTCTVDHGERFISSKSSATMIRKDFERR